MTFKRSLPIQMIPLLRFYRNLGLISWRRNHFRNTDREKNRKWDEDKRIWSDKKGLGRETSALQVDPVEHRQVRDGGRRKQQKEEHSGLIFREM